ncbi:type II secretion system protein [Campylobacter sp. 46490-21]|uniref:type II secretion system protein n=1 Tax=Campylobacter magnus TaxID=3026462 RepID=UPI00235E5FBA|nr:type II secretion system protein [Campylobacter magnus]MDD0848056.1 type II secretion system protein [Campylobacter magnus]
MKKGFTMIELIFVIVILGILASVAIPRLAATRTDAEISATVANLRTLISDVASYYAVKGEFGANTKWQDITNVPLLKLDGKNPINDFNKATNNAFLAADGKKCIAVKVVNKKGNIPAHILFGKDSENKTKGVCGEVLKADAVKAFVEARGDGVELGDSKGDGAIVIGSSTTIY